MRAAASVLAALAFLLSTLSSTHAAFDFTQHPALLALGTCQSAQPGTNTPSVDKARTKMLRNEISMASFTVPVEGRKMTMYLGTNATDPTCFAELLGNTVGCRYDYMLAGNWTGLRACGWSAPDFVSRKGFEVRNNTVWLEWQDLYSNGQRRASRYSFPVSIALPTVVKLDTEVKIIEDSGIKNFNVTGLSFEAEGESSKFILIDFTMFSRFPNNLTLASGGAVTLPGYVGNITVVQYNPPTCIKTDGSNASFNINDFCYQSGTVRIDVGPVCQVGGKYAFNFDTDCFANSGLNNCTGKVLSANALIGSEDENGNLVLDLCGGLFVDASDVIGILTSDQPMSYRMKPMSHGPMAYMTWVYVNPAVDALKITTSNVNCTMGGGSIANGVPKACGVFVDVSRPQSTQTRYFITAVLDAGFIKMVLVIFQNQANGLNILAWNGGYWKIPVGTTISSLTPAIIATAYAQKTPVENWYQIRSFTYAVPEPILPAEAPLAKRQVDGYYFGDEIKLTAMFESPQVPIYESRLTKLILERTNVSRTPNIGAAYNFMRNKNTTLVDSPLGPSGPNALSQLALNSNFTYIPGADIVNFTMTPGMMPADTNETYSDLSFLTTDDFDSVTDYTFYATFRIYFDQQSANGQRRRRLKTRDVNIPSSSLRQSTKIDAQLTRPYTGPPGDRPFDVSNEAAVLVIAQPTGDKYTAVYIGLGVTCAVFALANCALCAVFLVKRRKDRKRHEATMNSGLAGEYTKMVQ